MKAKIYGKRIIFVPENTHDAYLLGRLFEKTRSESKAGISTGSDKGRVFELLDVRFDAAELVVFLLSNP